MSRDVQENGSTKVTDDELFETTGRLAPEHADSVSGSSADAGDIIEAIQKKAVAGSPQEIWTTDMTLPGFGTQYDNCGDDHDFFCPDCGKPTIFGRTCYRSQCSRCAPAWALRQSASIGAKLQALRRYRDSYMDKHQRFHHVVVSPPADWDPKADPSWEEALKVTKKVLKKAGLEGIAFYHPYKGVDGDDRGAWKERLFEEDRDWNDVQNDLKFAPHFHCIVVGHKVPGGQVTRAVEAMTGWVIHRITKQGTNVSIYDEHDLARAVSYSISHTGLYESDEETQSAYRWFGTNTNRATADEETELWMDAVTRRVAPKTLGLEYNNLACGAEVTTAEVDEEMHNHEKRTKVDVAYAEATRTPSYSGSGSGSTSSSSSPDLESSAGDVPSGPLSGDRQEPAHDSLQDPLLDKLERAVYDDVDDEAETQKCMGRLVDIAAAPSYLEDEDWCRTARFAEELAETAASAADDLDYFDWDLDRFALDRGSG